MILLLRGHLAVSEDIFGCQNLEGAFGIQWVETGLLLAEYPVHIVGWTPATKNYLVQNVSRATTEKVILVEEKGI